MPAMSDRKPDTSFDAFQDLEIRAGRVTAAEPFPEARNPAMKLTLDFGHPVGVL